MYKRQEEENKIIPEIIIGSGLTNELFGKLFQCEAFPIILITEAEINIEKIVKPIIPFCDNGWRLFINIDNGSITTGIMRSFAGPSAPSLLAVSYPHLDVYKRQPYGCAKLGRTVGSPT